MIVTDPAALAFEGSELVRQLKDHPTTALIPVLGVTAQPYSEQQQSARAARCDALLMMPVTATTLGDVARLLMARAGLLRQRSTGLTKEATARRLRSRTR